jgi:lipoprotein NlpI
MAIVESTAEYWAEVAEVSGAKSSAPGSRICKAADNIATLKQLLNKVENNSRNTRRHMKTSEIARLEKALHNYAIQVDILHTLLFSLGNLYEALGKRMARSERNWRKAVEHAESTRQL